MNPVPRPLPQPLATTTPLSVAMELPILGISCKKNHTACDPLCLASLLSIMFLRSIHGVARAGVTVLFTAKCYSLIWTPHICFTHHQLTDTGLFATGNSAALNVLVEVLFEHLFQFSWELLDPLITLCFTYEKPQDSFPFGPSQTLYSQSLTQPSPVLKGFSFYSE